MNIFRNNESFVKLSILKAANVFSKKMDMFDLTRVSGDVAMTSPMSRAKSQLVKLPPISDAHPRSVEAQKLRMNFVNDFRYRTSALQRNRQGTASKLSSYKVQMDPFFLTHERGNAKVEFELNDIKQRLDSAVQQVGDLAAHSDVVVQKLESSMIPKITERMKNFKETLQALDQQISAFRDGETGTAEITDQITECKRNHTEMLGFRHQMRVTTDKIATSRERLDRLEKSLSVFVNRMPKSDLELLERMAKRNKTLKNVLMELEEEGMRQMVDTGMHPLLDSMSQEGMNIDQGVGEFCMQMKTLKSDIEANAMTDKMTSQTINDSSRDVLDFESETNRINDELSSALARVETNLKNLAIQVQQTCTDFEEDKETIEKFNITSIDEEVTHISNEARDYLTALKSDWEKFNSNNTEAQRKLSNEITALSSNGAAGNALNKRLDAAERRVKWCVDRINVWKRESSRSMTLFGGGNGLLERVEHLEASLLAAETAIARRDRLRTKVKPWVNNNTADAEHPVPPEAVGEGRSTRNLRIPQGLELTYPDNEPMNIQISERQKKPAPHLKTSTNMMNPRYGADDDVPVQRQSRRMKAPEPEPVEEEEEEKEKEPKPVKRVRHSRRKHETL